MPGFLSIYRVLVPGNNFVKLLTLDDMRCVGWKCDGPLEISSASLFTHINNKDTRTASTACVVSDTLEVV